MNQMTTIKMLKPNEGMTSYNGIIECAKNVPGCSLRTQIYTIFETHKMYQNINDVVAQ